MNNIYWATDDETYNLDNLDEVIESLLFYNEAEDLAGTVVSYGTAKPFSTDWVNADDVLEMIASRAYDEAGEWSEDFPDVSAEAEEELQMSLSDWQAKHCVASFWSITETTNYTITQEDVDNYFTNGGE